MSHDRIGIFGATSKAGKLVVQLLKSQGHHNLKLVARNETTILNSFPEEHANGRFVVADITKMDEVDMARILEDVRYVIWCIGGFSFLHLIPKPFLPYKVDYLGMRMLVDCANASKGRIIHITVMSGLLITKPYHPLSLLLNLMGGNLLKWKLAGEEYLRNSRLNYTIVRAGGLTNNMEPENLVISQGDKISGQVSRLSCAQIMIEATFNGEISKNKTIDVIARTKKGEAINNDILGSISILKNDNFVKHRKHKDISLYINLIYFLLIVFLYYLIQLLSTQFDGFDGQQPEDDDVKI